MDKPPHCPDFRPKPTAPWLCVWWDSEEIQGVTEWFCSLPDWDYRVCETLGMLAGRNEHRG